MVDIVLATVKIHTVATFGIMSKPDPSLVCIIWYTSTSIVYSKFYCLVCYCSIGYFCVRVE